MRIQPRYLAIILGFITNMSIGMTTYIWSLFIVPLQNEFGWPVADISLAFSLCCLVFGGFSVFAGKLCDRFGVRATLLLGGLLMGSGLLAAAFTSSKQTLYLSYGLLVGMGMACVYIPPIAVVPRWWPGRKGFATGIIVVGVGLGTFLMGPVVGMILKTPGLGWREAFMACSATAAVLVLVPAMLFPSPPAGACRDASGSPVAVQGYTLAETIRTRQFFWLYIGFFGASFAGILVVGHLASFGKASGFSTMESSIAVSAFALANVFTRFFSGYCADHFNTKYYLVLNSTVQAIAIGCFYSLGSVLGIYWSIAAIIAWNYGGIFIVLPIVCEKSFGGKAHGANYGFLYTAWGIAGFVAPWAGGWLKDVTASYSVPFMVAACMALVSAMAFGRLRASAFSENA